MTPSSNRSQPAGDPHSKPASRLWYHLGYAIAGRPWPMVMVWLFLLVVSVPASRLAHTVLHGGGGFVPGSDSEKVDHILRDNFDTSFLYPALVIVTSPKHSVQDAKYKAAVRLTQQRLRKVPQVGETRSYLDLPHWEMTSRDGHTTVVLVGMRGRSTEEVEGQIPDLREALSALLPQLQTLDPGMRVLVTSDTAFNYDIDELSAKDCDRAEERALPFIVVCLLAAFGSLVAAGLPLVIGLLSTTITGAVVFALGHVMPLSILIQNVYSMVGLGTGIDYALVMVIRFREELGQGQPVREAVATTVATSGRAVAGSGIMVMVGMVSLFISSLEDLRSISLGCILVVLVAVAVTLTLLPALLALLGPRVHVSKWLPGWLGRAGTHDAGWMAWATYVVDHPWGALALGLTGMALLTWPAFQMVTGMPDGTWMPRQAESRQGYELLSHMGHSGLLSPISIVVQAPAGESMLTRPHLTELHTMVQNLLKNPDVESAQSLVSVESSMDLEEYIANYEDPSMLEDGALKDVATALLSRNRNATLIHVVPANGLKTDDLVPLIRSLRALGPHLKGTDLTVTVGGYGGWTLDFRQALQDVFPSIVAMVMVLTWITLFWVFRSWLLPVKAILMNVMSVGTAFGVLVMIFQWGWMASLIGMPEPPGRILVALPVMLFCIVFGLSMDYEVFLVSRIQEFWRESSDNRVATIHGLACTGRMITSAAMIMMIIFGCFALADMVMVKMLGLGLAVAVGVDATVIRIALVPAFMQLLGKYNWVPGRRGALPCLETPAMESETDPTPDVAVRNGVAPH